MTRDWGLTEEETKVLLKALQTETEILPERWSHLTIAIPDSFVPIFKETLEAYRIMTDSEKDFPALEAIIMEARNSLPPDVLQCIDAKKD